jgi:hypothetical protein
MAEVSLAVPDGASGVRDDAVNGGYGFEGARMACPPNERRGRAKF